MHRLRLLLRHISLTLVALILLFEEWGWEPLAKLFARLSRLPTWARVERCITRLPPWAAVAAFFVPALGLFPIKLAALFLVGDGHPLLGLGLLVAAKVVGTALLAWLFTLTQPTLMRLRWFAHWYPRWKAWKDTLIAHVRRSPFLRSVARFKAAARTRWDAFRARYPGAARK